MTIVVLHYSICILQYIVVSYGILSGE